MEVFLFTFLVLCLAMVGMALGVLAGRRPLEGGCGRSDCADRAGVGCGVCETGEGSREALRTNPESL